MLRPGRGPSAAAATAYPDYEGGGASIPSGGYGVGYGHQDSYASGTSHSSYPASQGGSQYGGSSYGNNHGGYNYSSSSNNYSSSSNNYSSKDKPFRGQNKQDAIVRLIKLYAKDPINWVALVAALFFLSTIHYRGQRNWILRAFQVPSLKSLSDSFLDASGRPKPCPENKAPRVDHAAEHELRSQVANLEKEIKMLEKERSELRSHGAEEHKEHVSWLTSRDYAWKEQVEVLQNATQREAKRSATELFGPGPHHVKFTIILPSDDDELERNFIVEMAPLDLMPHSVHFFLQQVVHGLWSNAWFYLNGPHVLQGGPQAEEDEEDLWHMDHIEDDARAVALKKWRDLDLENLAFPEYSEKFPHEKWTLGFTGRPGGPDFYINKLDNRATHGPGGQHQHDLDEYGDPCFAKVVDGFDVLQMMYKEPTYHDEHEYGWFLMDPIHIVDAHILEDVPLHIDAAKKSDDHSRKSNKPLAKPHIDHQVDP